MDPALLPGDLPTKALTAALRRCSSSISLFLLRRIYRKPPPIAQATTTTPTTTPATMPATLVPPSLEAVSVGVDVTMRVFSGAAVVAAGALVLVGVAELLLDSASPSLLTVRLSPVL